jgi:serine/threonine protein kinase
MRIGDRVSDYVIERLLGEGGMATVYLARHEVLDQQVAIKILDPEVARKSGVKERFIQEANIQANLKHQHIVSVLTATKTASETPVLVMEYLNGESLSEVLQRRITLPVDDAIKIMEQVLAAVGYAHQSGVIHRDLKPSNIMVMANGEAKVTDFGIAKVLGSTKLTRTGTAMGSAHYMSPEQIRRPESVDARSDIYSLGCVFYEVLAGRPPFGEKDASGTESDYEVKTAHVTEVVPALETVKTGIPAWLAKLVMSMLAKEPNQRPTSCEVIEDAIRSRRNVEGRQVTKEENVQEWTLTENDYAKSHETSLQQEEIKPKDNMTFIGPLFVIFFIVTLFFFFPLYKTPRNDREVNSVEPTSNQNVPTHIEASMPPVDNKQDINYQEEKKPNQRAGSGPRPRDITTADVDSQRWKFNYYSLEKPMLSNLSGSRKVMQITLTIMTHYDDRVIKNVRTHELALRAGILDLMRTKTEADLKDPDFRKQLADEIRLVFNSLLEKYEGFGGIEEVMFSEFSVR